MEIRTKSVDIQHLIDTFPTPPRKTEICFSLTPQGQYEHGTPGVKMRLRAASRLKEKGWRVGCRLQPIIPGPTSIQDGHAFLEMIQTEYPELLDCEWVYGFLTLTQKDYNAFVKKRIPFIPLSLLHERADGLYRAESNWESSYRQMIRSFLPHARECFPEK